MRIESVNNYQSYTNLNISHKSRSNSYNRIREILKDDLQQMKIKQPIVSTSPWQFIKNHWFSTIIASGLIFFGSEFLLELKKHENFVEPAQVEFNNKKNVRDYAIDRITQYLNKDNPLEYGVLVDKNYNIISEAIGDSSSVNMYPFSEILKNKLNISASYIKFHGHPEQIDASGKKATQTFSFQDFRTFNNFNSNKESYVVNKYGQICLLRKKNNYKKLSEEELNILEKQYFTAFQNSWANPVNVYKNGKIIHTFYDYQGMHAFWKRVADKYNLEYYTNFGVFEGIDAYEDYYYPDLIAPAVPTSHKSFKLK